MTVPPRISSESIDVLSTSSHSEVRRLSVQVIDGTVVISGQVSSYYHKQVAQEAVRKAKHDSKLLNLVHVGSAS